MADRKEKINQYKNNVSFHATDIRYDVFQAWYSSGLVSSSGQLDLQDLEMAGEKRKAARELVMIALRHMVQISISNIVRDVYNLISKMDTESLVNG